MADLDYASDDELPTPAKTDPGAEDQMLLGRMARFRRNPFNWVQEIALYVTGTGWRAYDNTIGQNCFYPGYTSRVKGLVLSSPLLNQKVADLTEARLRVELDEDLLKLESKEQRRAQIESSLGQIVGDMVDKMMCKMESKLYIRTAFYGCTQLLTRAYSGIHVNPEEIARLRQVAAAAAEKKQSIIFLPRHSSHLDYVSLQLICYRLGLTLPIVVAGDNLNIPVVGNFLQSCGAMWIRRSFDNDSLYTSVVQAYLDSLLQNGYNLECFIEGTRSRTGKLLQPKFGILSFFLDSVLSGRTHDVYICPVSLQYDKVIEVDSYVTELLGKPKQKENLAGFLSASSVLSLNLGRVDCRFHEPWSLRDFIEKQKTRQEQAQGAPPDRTRLLRTLGYTVLSNINEVSVVMPSALVGTVLLTLRGRGVGMSELIRRVEWLCDRIRSNGGRVADFHGMSTQYVVERALEVLGPELIGKVGSLAEDTYHTIDRFQLSFYRNMTIHLFIPESLISAALYTKVKQGGGNSDQRIRLGELTEKVRFLSDLFRGEFIFPAGQGLRFNMRHAMDSLISAEVLELSGDEGDGQQVGLTRLEREKGRENFDFYCFLIWPFCDGAWLGVVSMLCLVPPQGILTVWRDYKQVQDTAQLFGRTLYHQGDLSYFEAINKEVLKNVYNMCEERGIIIVGKSKDLKVAPMVRLAPQYMPERDAQSGALLPKGELWEFIERISQHRREGKNRRDNATVSTRVLDLAAKLGDWLFAQPEAVITSEDPGVQPAEKSQAQSKL